MFFILLFSSSYGASRPCSSIKKKKKNPEHQNSGIEKTAVPAAPSLCAAIFKTQVSELSALNLLWIHELRIKFFKIFIWEAGAI